MDFNVGDRIIIKSVKEIKENMNNRYDLYYSYVSSMKKYSNKSYIIKNINKEHKEYVELEIKKTHNFKWHYTWISRYNGFFNDEDFMI